MPRAVGSHLHYARYLWDIFADFGAADTIAADTLYLTPINIPFWCKTNAIVVVCDTIGTGGNFRAGIYADNDDTPDGGALQVQLSAAVAAVANGKNEMSITETELTPGLYWLALICDAAQPKCYQTAAGFYQYALGTLTQYTKGVTFGELSDPCPSTLTATENNPHIGLLISEVP